MTHTDTNTPVTLQSQLPGAPLSWRLSHIHLQSVPLSLSDLFLQEDFKSATDRRFLDTRPSFLRPGGGRSDPHAPPPLRLHVSLYNKAASPEAWSLPGEHADASPGACKLTNYLSALEGGLSIPQQHSALNMSYVKRKAETSQRVYRLGCMPSQSRNSAVLPLLQGIQFSAHVHVPAASSSLRAPLQTLFFNEGKPCSVRGWFMVLLLHVYHFVSQL